MVFHLTLHLRDERFFVQVRTQLVDHREALPYFFCCFGG